MHRAGLTDIQTATDAAGALEPLAGKAAKVLFAIRLNGVRSAGGAGADLASGFALAEALGWRHGLDEKLAKAPGFYSIIVVSTLVGLSINYLGISPMRALFGTAVINGLLAPPCWWY